MPALSLPLPGRASDGGRGPRIRPAGSGRGTGSAHSKRRAVVAVESTVEQSASFGMSYTGHRNLFPFHAFVRNKKVNKDSESSDSSVGDPLSFWVGGLEWDDEAVLRIVHHLNYYLTYYDSRSPTILVHTPQQEASKPRTRYIAGSFPSRIESDSIDVDLLQMWAAGRTGDAGRMFVYYYRIIEHASHVNIEQEVRARIRRLLVAPHTRSDVGRLTDDITAAALATKMDDGQKMQHLLKTVVDVRLLWREIEQNREAFSANIVFDGGFELRSIIDEKTTFDNFQLNWQVVFTAAARDIRNHLSHGRDRRTQATITPTPANFRRLDPWVAAISVVAGEVITFKDLA